jgi:hypothetical protein
MLLRLHVSRWVSFSVGLLALVVSGALGIGVAFGQSEDAPSPARGQASVIAQGVTALPVGEVGWRVRLASTATASDQTERDVPGFILVDQGALLVNDLDAGRQTRLATGEATFLPARRRRRVLALAEGDTNAERTANDEREQSDAITDPARHVQAQEHPPLEKSPSFVG